MATTYVTTNVDNFDAHKVLQRLRKEQQAKAAAMQQVSNAPQRFTTYKSF